MNTKKQVKFEKFSFDQVIAGDIVVVDVTYNGRNPAYPADEHNLDYGEGGSASELGSNSSAGIMATVFAQSGGNLVEAENLSENLIRPSNTDAYAGVHDREYQYWRLPASDNATYYLHLGFGPGNSHFGSYTLTVHKWSDFYRCIKSLPLANPFAAQESLEVVIPAFGGNATSPATPEASNAYSPQVACKYLPPVPGLTNGITGDLYSEPFYRAVPFQGQAGQKVSVQITRVCMRRAGAPCEFDSDGALQGEGTTGDRDTIYGLLYNFENMGEVRDPYNLAPTAAKFTFKTNAERDDPDETYLVKDYTLPRTGWYAVVLVKPMTSTAAYATSLTLKVTGASGGGSPTCTLRGDVNCDGNVSIGDVVLVRRFVATGELPAELTAIGNARLKLTASGTDCSATATDVTIGDLVLLRGMVVDPAATRILCTPLLAS